MDQRIALSRGIALALLGSVVMTQVVAADVAAHPARIATGSCPDAGQAVATLDDVVGEWTPDPVGTIVGLPTYPVRASVTEAVPVGYESLFVEPHSIVIFEYTGDEDATAPILCGDLSGFPLSDTDLAIGLGELNGSGWSGIATVHDNGDATVSVEVYMTPRDAVVAEE